MRKSGREGKRLPFSVFSVLEDLFFAVCIAFSLMMDMNVRSGNIYHNWSVSQFLHTPAITVIFTAVFLLLLKARRHVPAQGWGMRVLSLLLGVWWVLACSVRNTQDINQPFLNSGQLLKTMVSALGMAAIYELLFRLLAHALSCWTEIKPLKGLGLIEIYKKHTIWVCTAAVLVMWLPQAVIAYPCSMNSDSATQVMQALGLAPRVANHPPFGTMLIECAIRLGKMLGSHSAGLYVYVLLQCVLSALVIGYCQYVMRLLRAPHWLRIASLLICGMMPVYCDNVTVILKDVPYAYAAVLLLCEALRVQITDGDEYALTLGHLLRVLAAGIILLNIRNNGLGIYIPIVVVVLARVMKKRNRRLILNTAVVLLLPFLCTMGIEKALTSQNEIVPRSPREALSLPFQQTARFVRDHADEIPKEEQDAIAAVLLYERIADFYNPVLSDPVKATYNEEATAAELMDYFRVWAKQFKRDPMCYFKATFVQNALLFDPQTNNVAIFMDTGLFDEAAEMLGVYKPDALRKIEWLEGDLHWLLFSLPLVPQLNSLGFYCILLVGALALARYNRIKEMGVIFWPMIIVLVMLVLGPCIENQDRYAFPIVYSMPLLLSCLSYYLRLREKN